MITDLTAGNPTDTSLALTWTAPGDDDTIGKASAYKVWASHIVFYLSLCNRRSIICTLSYRICYQRTIGGTGNDIGYSIARTADNGFVIVGSTTSSGAGGEDVYVIKTDADGVL
jgi:hypothetical protein